MFRELLLDRTFGHPTGLLGRLGGRVMSRSKGEFVGWIVDELELDSTERVLEVGFGPGVGIERFAEAVSEGFVAGVDPSAEMLDQARKRNAAAIEAGVVDLRRGSADDVPADDHVFDAAVTMNSMQTWADPMDGLRELHRVLKPGGAVAVAFTPHSGQSRDELAGLLTEAGFENKKIDDCEWGFCAFAEA
ncbi:class I SAM-dependent methyltransferase (plasmid) [Haladaptatus sp. SPP-AMP-3]|uniref:class I SAM-dependent methyltransferase n=1 Tax=Haladaptatus sp. SPP-AMP-3 TaxID=3121295 RepID=UPI003C2AE34A